MGHLPHAEMYFSTFLPKLQGIFLIFLNFFRIILPQTEKIPPRHNILWQIRLFSILKLTLRLLYDKINISKLDLLYIRIGRILYYEKYF